MTDAIAFPEFSSINEKQAKLVARIVTAVVATLILLFVFFWQFVTHTPAIDPPADMPTVEIGFFDGSGGDAVTQGGGSNGNTGTPGMQNPTDAGNPQPKNPADNGAVTDNSSDNPSAATNNHNGTATQQTVTADAETQQLLNNWKKNKAAATIHIGGDGTGDPYTAGAGSGSGIDHGTGTGDPGTGIPGGDKGTSATGHRVRHILYKPDIVNPTQEEGKVVVNVFVDRSGTVTNVTIGDGSTTMNSTLKATATQSAYHIKFDADPSGPESLVLPIDIYFTLK